MQEGRKQVLEKFQDYEFGTESNRLIYSLLSGCKDSPQETPQNPPSLSPQITTHTHPQQITSLHVSSSHVFLGLADGGIELWDPLTLTPFTSDVYMSHDTSVLCLASSPILLVSADSEGCVKVWKYTEKKLVKKITCFGSSPVTALCFNFNCSKLVVGSCNNDIYLYGLKSSQILQTFKGHTSFVSFLALSPDETRLLSSASDLRMWDVKTGACVG